MALWKKNVKFAELGRKVEMCVASLGYHFLLPDTLLKDSGHVSEYADSGDVVDGAADIIKKQIEDLDGRLIYNYSNTNFSQKIFIWEDSIIEFIINDNYHVTINSLSQKEEFIDYLRTLINPHRMTHDLQGQVYAIVSLGGRLSLSAIGNAGIPLIRHNYTSKIINDYDYVCQDLQSLSPSGRIVILEGEAGTGKSFMVRGMLLNVPNAMFILVPPDMVSSLGGPEFLPLLLQYKHTTSGPIILVLEDADKCLVTRDGANMNVIQSLLNLGDGILGSLLDVRIIATTNANKLEMEKAILRPGRLSRRIEVGALDQNTVLNVIKFLLPDNESVLSDKRLTDEDITLAQVYFIAREHGWMPKINHKKEKLQPDLNPIDDDDCCTDQ